MAETDLSKDTLRKLRLQRRRRRSWRKFANGIMVFGVLVLVVGCTMGYQGYQEDNSHLYKMGWAMIGLGVVAHFIRGCMPSGNPDETHEDD